MQGAVVFIGPVARLVDALFSGNVLRESSLPVGYWLSFFCPSWLEPGQQAMAAFFRLGKVLANEAQH